MAYLSAARVTFTPKFHAMSEEERLAEQIAAAEIVTKCGGTTKGQYVMWTDNCVLSLTEFADEASALLCHQAIIIRGAFDLVSQRAVPLDEVMKLYEDAKGIAGV